MNIQTNRGQTAVEYMLMLALVAGIVLVAMPTQLPRINDATELYFNRAANFILGEPPRCGDGVCQNIAPKAFENNERCCDDCGGC